jgi:hypothetical protein
MDMAGRIQAHAGVHCAHWRIEGSRHGTGEDRH